MSNDEGREAPMQQLIVLTNIFLVFFFHVSLVVESFVQTQNPPLDLRVILFGTEQNLPHDICLSNNGFEAKHHLLPLTMEGTTAIRCSSCRCNSLSVSQIIVRLLQTLAFRASKIVASKERAAEERSAQIKQGILLDGRKQFRFALMRNYGIGWGRSLQILKHLEMHEHAPPPPITPSFKEKVLHVAKLVKQHRYRPPARII